MLRERRRQANYKPNRRLDRKSSRGMIYENEELRLRTININAEVERGQSDIRKLRRENEILRREIWSLRDEYDKLNKILKTFNENSDNNQCNTGDGKNCSNNDEDEYHNCSDGESDSQSDNSGSCDCGRDDNNDDDWYDNEINNSTEQQKKIPTTPIKMKHPNISIVQQEHNNEVPGSSKTNVSENCCDHLSVVSEETLQNIDEPNYVQQQQLMTFSPTTPTDQLIPPLSHFENIIEECYTQNEDLNSQSGGTTSSSTTTGETVIQKECLNDWDFNLQSPFLQRKQYHLLQQQRHLTTFTCAPATAVTTTSTTTSPKHFFSPLKPKIHLKSLQAMISEIPTLSSSQPTIDPLLGMSMNDAGLENSTLKSSLNTILSPELAWESRLNNNNNTENVESYKPDICVSNVLGSPLRSARQTTKDDSTKQRQQQYRESYFQNGGDLEDLLQDMQLMSDDILKMQMQKTITSSAESLSMNSAFTGLSDMNKSLDNISKNAILNQQSFNYNPHDNIDRKPYRSEMNLVLNYNGQNPVFVPTSRPATPLPTQPSTISTIKKILQHANSENDLINDNKSRDLIDSSLNYSNINIPSDSYQDQRSQIPRPMTLFPKNHTYLGFEPIDRQLPEPSISLNTSIPIPISPLIVLPPPPSPLAHGGHFYHNTPILAIHKLQDPTIVQQAVQKNLKNSTEPKTATINSASMKRSQFSMNRSDNFLSNDNIVVDKDSFDHPHVSINADNQPARSNSAKEAKIKIVPSLSDKNEDSSITNPSKLQKQNSLHSSNENKDQQQCNRHNSGNSKRQHHHHHHHHHQKSGANLNRKLSQESSAAESNTESLICGGTAPEALPNKSTKENDLLKLSSGSSGSSPANKISHNNRRHSEGLLIPPTSTHHHHHSRNTAMHDSHHDLFSAGNGTSISERNSNSLGSSRESSATSLSLRSQKNSHPRKISISSHNDGTGNNGGGKIPWCACWGNGCL